MNDEYEKIDNLEILLITYNRCNFLEKTLRMLKDSPFRLCKITIIDNCSPDDTAKVVSFFSNMFPNLKYLRNRVNISGNPNYLKAIELSSKEYTWILCDDDNLDFSACDDVLDTLKAGDVDLIEVGATERGDWPRGDIISVQEMLKKGFDYYFRMSFFPAYIFRTEKFDSFCFSWGYKHIDQLYPQFEFLNKSVREDFKLYLAKNRIVVRNDVNDHSFAPLPWYEAWVSCCRTITDPVLRGKTIEDATKDRGFFKCLGFWTILDRHLAGKDEFVWRILTILRGMNWGQRFKYISVLPVVFLPVPLSFWVWVRSKIYKIMDIPEEDIPPLNILDRG